MYDFGNSLIPYVRDLAYDHELEGNNRYDSRVRRHIKQKEQEKMPASLSKQPIFAIISTLYVAIRQNGDGRSYLLCTRESRKSKDRISDALLNCNVLPYSA